MRKVSKRDRGRETIERVIEEMTTTSQEITSLIEQVEEVAARPIVAAPPKKKYHEITVYDGQNIRYVECSSYRGRTGGTAAYDENGEFIAWLPDNLFWTIQRDLER